MHIICPQCKKKININVEQLPTDKEKAGVKCGQCSKVIVFRIPQKSKQNTDSTIISSDIQFDLVHLGDRPKIVVLKGPSQGNIAELKDGVNSVGRSNIKNMPDIAIEGDPIVSRTHCYIEIVKTKTGSRALLYDCNAEGELCSTNGTFINKRQRKLTKFDRVYLATGDQIYIGESLLELC